MSFEGEFAAATDRFVDPKRQSERKTESLSFESCAKGSMIQGEERKRGGGRNSPRSALFAKAEPPPHPCRQCRHQQICEESLALLLPLSPERSQIRAAFIYVFLRALSPSFLCLFDMQFRYSSRKKKCLRSFPESALKREMKNESAPPPQFSSRYGLLRPCWSQREGKQDIGGIEGSIGI